MMADVFSRVGAYKPGKTSFNLRHSNLVTMDFGKLYPVDVIETLPGDVWQLDSSVVGRLASALKSPILADIDLVVEAFFCPTRLLQGSDANFDTPVGERNFEEFLVGGKDGNEVISLPVVGLNSEQSLRFQYSGIADYIGVQPDVLISRSDVPLAYPWRAYRWIWNEFYRFEALQEEIQVCQYLGNGIANSDDTIISDYQYDALLYRGWRRDYFTSCLPFQQFGTSPAFTIAGTLPVEGFEFSGLDLSLGVPNNYFDDKNIVMAKTKYNTDKQVGNQFPQWIEFTAVDNIEYRPENNVINIIDKESGSYGSLVTGKNGYVDLNNAVTFDVSDIRTNFQIQKWMERNARGGVRYTEYLRSHFGVSPSDARLQRPEFIGAFRLPWLTSEVLQTSGTDSNSVQGNQAGQSIALGKGKLGNKYRAYEFGYIMVIASVVPKPTYQQGLPRMLSRKTKFDFYSPEFAHLSEQAVLNKELYISGNTDKDNGIFGFQGIWNELRYLPNRVSGHMRSNATDYSYDYWHTARLFASTPVLNKEFLEVGSTDAALKELKRVFAVQDEDAFIVDFGFNFRAMRPLPYLAEPGLIDHF